MHGMIKASVIEIADVLNPLHETQEFQLLFAMTESSCKFWHDSQFQFMA